MRNIVFAWELGANFGHLSQDLPIAETLRARGFEVSFVVRDLRVAAQLLQPAGFAFTAAPAPRPQPSGTKPPSPASFAEILAGAGLADPTMLDGVLQAWFRLLDLIRPDLLVADFAPMALIAARCRGLPVVQLSTGFDAPPASSPLPSIRPWDVVPVERLLGAEARLLEQFNRVLSTHGKPSVIRFADLFIDHLCLLTTLPELDHYGMRIGADYVGPIFGTLAGPVADWPAAASRRILAYLRPTVPGAEALLAALAASSTSVICAMPGALAQWCRKFNSSTFQLFDHALALAPLLAGADAMITYGGVGATAQGLLAGVPLLIAPHLIEQQLIGLCVERIGAGVLIGYDRSQRSYADALRKLLDHPGYKEAARRVADQYWDHTPAFAIERAADHIERAANTLSTR